MSVYDVNHLGHAILRDDELCRGLRTDPEATLETWDLTTEERKALLAGDIATLYHLGAHEYLLWNFARMGVFGLDPAKFSERIRAAGERSPS